MNRKKGLAVILVILVAVAMSSCSGFDISPGIADDEILLEIQLDIKEDIGLLVVDYDADGFSGSGGTSNADKSLLKQDELLLHTLDKKNYGNLPDVISLSLQFTIITAYFNPNYENIYPSEYTKPLDAIDFEAAFGESYRIKITGDKTNGYTAVLDGCN